MRNKFATKVFTFVAGGTLSIAITVLTIALVYSSSLKSFEFGKAMGSDLTKEREPLEMEIIIKEGDSIDDLAETLFKAGAIQDKMLFKIECLLKGKDKGFKPGKYKLNAAMNADEINLAIRASNANAKKIVILEGYSIANIATYLEDKEIVKASDFIKACKEETFDYPFLKDLPKRENRLEGYLFPDTYFVSENATPKEIINKMLTRFGQIHDTEIRVEAEKAGLTVDQVIIIASLIEKEVRFSQDRKKFSSVIKNRLAKDMPLEMTSTVVYAFNKREDRLTEDDLKAESPYNTYVSKGLPKGPITNPGLASIEAALNPEETAFIYFVVQDKKIGNYFFTDNEKEYNTAKEAAKKASESTN